MSATYEHRTQSEIREYKDFCQRFQFHEHMLILKLPPTLRKVDDFSLQLFKPVPLIEVGWYSLSRPEEGIADKL